VLTSAMERRGRHREEGKKGKKTICNCHHVVSRKGKKLVPFVKGREREGEAMYKFHRMLYPSHPVKKKKKKKKPQDPCSGEREEGRKSRIA